VARPEGLADRRFFWLEPQVANGRPDFGDDRYIYAPVILLRTWTLLQQNPAVAEAAHIERLVEQVYGDAPSVLEAELAAWEEQLAELHGDKVRKDAGTALQNAIYPPDHPSDPFAHRASLADEDDPSTALPLRALTRLGDPTVTVICAVAGPDGARISPDDPRDPEKRPSDRDERREWERSLLLRSVKLQSREWVRHFTAQPVPKAWEESPTLRHCRLAVFDGNRLREAPESLALDGCLGIVRHRDLLEKLEQRDANS
jgi:hypothetical protein